MKHIILILLIAIACTTTTQKIDPNVKYRMDMKIINGGKVYVGTVVLPKQHVYQLDFESPGTMSLFRFTTCSRDMSIEQESGKIIGRKKTSIQFVPTLIEKRGACIAHLGGYEKILGRHTSGMIDFQDNFSMLPARVACNGEIYRSPGVTLCQSKTGLIQRLDFDTPVFTKAEKGCEMDQDSAQSFEWEMKDGACSYLIQEEVAPYRQHRISTWGYEKIPLRGK